MLQVKARGAPTEEDSSIAAQLMRLRDPDTQQPLADRFLLPQISVLFWAGFDTTGNTMAWTLYCISQYPEVQFSPPPPPCIYPCHGADPPSTSSPLVPPQ